MPPLRADFPSSVPLQGAGSLRQFARWVAHFLSRKLRMFTELEDRHQRAVARHPSLAQDANWLRLKDKVLKRSWVKVQVASFESVKRAAEDVATRK